MFTVWHRINYIEYLKTRSIKESEEENRVALSEFEKVAEINCSNIDQAFLLTNNINHSWWDNPQVQVIKKSRSTSEGDLVIDSDGIIYRCMMIGWKEVEVKTE
jgi:hypothetical protein